MNPIGDTFRFYFKNLKAIVRPAVFFLLPPLVTLAAMVPGFMTHFSLLIEAIASFTGGTEIPPILSQRVSDFQMFLIPLILIFQMSGFLWQGAVTHLAGIRLGVIPAEGDPGPAMAVVRRIFPLLLTGLLVGSLMMLTGFVSMFTLFIPTAVLSVMTAYVPLAVMAEGSLGGSALVRSFRLVRGRFFLTAGWMLLCLLTGAVLIILLSLGAVTLIALFIPPETAAALPAPGAAAGSPVTLPENVVDAMGIGYIASLGMMFIVKFLVEIPLTFAGITLIYSRSTPAAPVSP
jgi:hypothetical protein